MAVVTDRCAEIVAFGTTKRYPAYQRIPNVSGKTIVSMFRVNARW